MAAKIKNILKKMKNEEESIDMIKCLRLIKNLEE